VTVPGAAELELTELELDDFDELDELLDDLELELELELLSSAGATATNCIAECSTIVESICAVSLVVSAVP